MPYQTLSLTSGLHEPGELLACWHEQTWSKMDEIIKVRVQDRNSYRYGYALGLGSGFGVKIMAAMVFEIMRVAIGAMVRARKGWMVV